MSRENVRMSSGRPRIRVGGNGGSSGTGFSGIIDSVFIYNAALSTAELDFLRTAVSLPATNWWATNSHRLGTDPCTGSVSSSPSRGIRGLRVDASWRSVSPVHGSAPLEWVGCDASPFHCTLGQTAAHRQPGTCTGGQEQVTASSIRSIFSSPANSPTWPPSVPTVPKV